MLLECEFSGSSNRFPELKKVPCAQWVVQQNLTDANYVSVKTQAQDDANTDSGVDLDGCGYLDTPEEIEAAFLEKYPFAISLLNEFKAGGRIVSEDFGWHLYPFYYTRIYPANNSNNVHTPAEKRQDEIWFDRSWSASSADAAADALFQRLLEMKDSSTSNLHKLYVSKEPPVDILTTLE